MELPPGLDTRQRNQAIDGFLSSLSSWDLVYLRRRMHDHEARIHLAALEDLPVEIILYLARFLELEDLLACREVCRSWRAAWTGGAVTASLCCRYFPGLTERHGLSHADGQNLFAATARRYIDKYLRPRPHAYFWSRWFVGADDGAAAAAAGGGGGEDMREDAFHRSECFDFGLDRAQMRYQDGMLVWQPGDSYVVINDLRSLTRKRCGLGASLVTGRKLDLQAVTRQLIVFSSVDLNSNSQICRELQIWNITLGEWRRFSLPGRYAKCYAIDDAVIALTSTGDAFFWHWGGPTVDLQGADDAFLAPPPGCVSCLQRVPGAIFHPTDKNVFFLAWVYKPAPVDSRSHVIVAVKFAYGQPVQRYETTVANPARTADPDNPYSHGILRFSLRCQRMNSHGLYMIGVAHTCLNFSSNKHTLAVSEWQLVCFNVFTETFSRRRYEKCLSSPKFHRPTWNWAEWHSIQAWDDYLVVLWQPRPHVIHEPCTFTELLLATDSVACIASPRDAFTDIVRPNRLEPALTIDTFHQRRSALASHIFMDDDFVVFAAPDSVLVSTFKGARGVVLPSPVDGNPLTSLTSLAVPRRTDPPQPLQTWDCDVYTTLEAPQSHPSTSLTLQHS